MKEKGAHGGKDKTGEEGEHLVGVKLAQGGPAPLRIALPPGAATGRAPRCVVAPLLGHVAEGRGRMGGLGVAVVVDGLDISLFEDAQLLGRVIP